MKKFLLLFVAMIASFATNAVADGLVSGKSYSVLDGVANKYWTPSSATLNDCYKPSSTPYYFTVAVDGDQVSLKDQNGHYVGGGNGSKTSYTSANADEFKWTLAAVEGSDGVYTLYQESVSGATGYAGGQNNKQRIYCNNGSAVNLTFTPALKVTYKFVDAGGNSVGDDQVGFALTGEAYPTVSAPTGYKVVSGTPSEGATVADATAADETYTIVCAIDNITWTVAITGAPDGSNPSITVDGTSYSSGETFTYSTGLTASDVTASAIDGYLSKVAVSHTETEGTVSVTYSADMTPVLPEGYVLKMGSSVAATMTPATGAKDNDHWYVLTQVRGGETMAYNNGSSTMKREASATAASIDGKAISANLKYLVRFIPTSYDGVYNMQFADGSFIQTTLTTGAQESAGMYFFYNINGEDGNYGWNLTTDGTTYGSIVDNNAAGETLAFWGTGQLTYTGGNNDWYIYTAEFEEAKPAVELTASATSAMVNTEITLTATASAFESDPTIAISYTKNGGEATALEGTTFTPTESGKYVFTATATLGSTVATSKEVTINVMSDQYAGTWWLKNNDASLYATYGTGYYGSEANLGETAKEVTLSIVNGAYNIQFVGQSKWLGQNSWDAQCYADGPQTAYSIEEVDGGIQIMTGSQYLTYAWDDSYSVNNIVWGTTASTWTLEKPQPKVTLAADATEVAPNTAITLTATPSNFDETPTIAYAVAIDGAAAVAIEGNTYTPTAEGTYVFTATATTDAQSATSNEVTVTVADDDPADAELAATLVGDWIENTTGYEGATSSNWAAFSVTDGAVTATADGKNVTFTGLLGDNSNVLTAKVDASAKTLTFANGQTVYYGGYDWTLGYDPDGYTSPEQDLVAKINEDGSLSLDGLSIVYSGSSYMYGVVSTLSRKTVADPNAELAAKLAGDYKAHQEGWTYGWSGWEAVNTDYLTVAEADEATITFNNIAGNGSSCTFTGTVDAATRTITFQPQTYQSYYTYADSTDVTKPFTATINEAGDSIVFNGAGSWYDGYVYDYLDKLILAKATVTRDTLQGYVRYLDKDGYRSAYLTEDIPATLIITTSNGNSTYSISKYGTNSAQDPTTLDFTVADGAISAFSGLYNGYAYYIANSGDDAYYEAATSTYSTENKLLSFPYWYYTSYNNQDYDEEGTVYFTWGNSAPDPKEPEPTEWEYIVDGLNGTAGHGDCTNTASAWSCKWTSTKSDPAVLTMDLLYADWTESGKQYVNNMKFLDDENGDSIQAYSANKYSTTYTANYTFTLSSDEYYVKSYSFEYVKSETGNVTVLDNDGNEYVSGTVYTVESPVTPVVFGLKGASASIDYIYIKNLKVVVAKGTPVPTGISSVTGAYTNTLSNGKYIQNGRVVIVNNGRKYNAAGQNVK